MEIAISILTMAFVAFAICLVLVACESLRNKYKIKYLGTEIEILKDRERINDKFVEDLYDSVISCNNKINFLTYKINNYTNLEK